MKMLNIRFVGLSLSLEKGLPLGSGLGSSAASAAAAAVAVNELFGRKLELGSARVNESTIPSRKKMWSLSLRVLILKQPTKKMRAALPAEIGMPHHVCNCSQARALVASVLQGDLVGLGEGIVR
ncbi:HOMOSERINE/4-DIPHOSPHOCYTIDYL-2-C-METHYL-D-ERYTHRITOL KINASE [Salix viminalis]|uniref:HOMOSERINE/4-DIPHOSPHOCYTIDYL-2-C-METHYL-D-ERYTHRITOL KINASE n=1 Tax=Salix viminalis TaxID=40686 RepID=A0A9Q0SCA9_SALVM|nr:HOMOSERINE/4-DIPHOSPHOCYTIDYL-2-C-METHYL-D-ERYTHRITOL KINASE [Salix viminalis]